MNRDDIIRMAREAGLSNDFENFGYPYLPELERFATLVYERAFIDGMQKQMQSSVDKAVNKMAQREWQGLTDEEAKEVWKQLNYDLNHGKFAADDTERHVIVEFYRVIEAKLKEKNT
jgi:hypothetical protein